MKLDDPRGHPLTPAEEKVERIRNAALLVVSALVLAALLLMPLV